MARRRLGIGPVRLSEDARELLAWSDWPGNVRELENVISRAALRASFRQPAAASVTIVPRDLDVAAEPRAVPLGEPAPTDEVEARSFRDRVDDYQRTLITDSLRRHQGNAAAAARELGLHRSNLHHLGRRLGIK